MNLEEFAQEKSLTKQMKCRVCRLFAGYPDLKAEADRGRASANPISYQVIAAYLVTRLPGDETKGLTRVSVQHHYVSRHA